VQPNDRGDAAVTALGERVLGRAERRLDLGEGVVPTAHVEQQLGQDALGLGQAYQVARVVGELAGLHGSRDRLIVAIEIAENRRLVELEHQAQIRQAGVPLRHRQRLLEQRHGLSGGATHGVDHRRQTQRPSGRPAIPGLRRRGARLRRDPVRGVHLAQAEVRAGGEDEQPGAMTRPDTRRVRRPFEHGQRLHRPALHRPARREGAVQVDHKVRPRYVGERTVGHLGRLRRVSHPVQGVGEPADE
jgi:hypothetical protein